MSVQWDDDAIRRLAQDAGKEAMQRARFAVASAPCPEHKAVATVTGVDPITGEFSMKPCCDEGRKTASAAISRAFSRPGSGGFQRGGGFNLGG